MALRSRPLKFSILQATHLQNGSCRSHIERRLTDHGVLEKQHSLPVALTQFPLCVTLEDPTAFQKCNKEYSNGNHQSDCTPVPFYCWDLRLQPWKDKPRGLRHVISSDVIASVRQHCKRASHDISEESRSWADANTAWTGIGQYECPYTQDDILWRMRSITVKTPSRPIKPVIAREFFKHGQMVSAKCALQAAIVSPTPQSACIKTSTAMSACVESADLDSDDISVESFVVSDFMYFMEYFMNGTFALEKSDDVECPLGVSRGDVDQSVVPPGVRREIPGVLYYALIPAVTDEPRKPPKQPVPDQNKPTLAQLETMREHFSETLPRLFVKYHDYSIYTEDIVFENYYFTEPYVTIGVKNYLVQLAKLRILAHFRFANVRIHILKMTVHEDDGSVRVRWRLSGIPQSRAFMFWKFLPWRYTKKVNTESEWHDGFSTFYLNGKGLVTKHRMDIVMPEQETVLRTDEELASGIAA